MDQESRPKKARRARRSFSPEYKAGAVRNRTSAGAGDTTELLTRNGKLFLAVTLDLSSKYVVGWALSPS